MGHGFSRDSTRIFHRNGGPVASRWADRLVFWRNVVPRQLKGLQVAFQTGPKTYEVHGWTSTVDEVRELLSRRGTRVGADLLPDGVDREPRVAV